MRFRGIRREAFKFVSLLVPQLPESMPTVSHRVRILSLLYPVILGITPPALATIKINASPKQTLSVDECNLLAAEVNQARSFMQVFEAEIAAFSTEAETVETLDDIRVAAQSYVDAVSNAALTLETTQQTLTQLTIRDRTLVQFRSDYAEVIGGLAIALHHAGAAMQRVADVPSEAELPATLEVSQSETATVVEQIEVLAVQESMLLRGVNEYCGVSE